MFLFAPVPLHLLFWEQRCWFTEQELWQAVCISPSHPLNAAALVAQTPEGTFESSWCQPTAPTCISHFLFVLPWKIVLVPGVCLARPWACIRLQTALQQSEHFADLSWFMETSLICCQLHSAVLNSLMHGQGRGDRVEKGQKGWWPAEVWPRYLASGEMGRTELAKYWVFPSVLTSLTWPTWEQNCVLFLFQQVNMVIGILVFNKLVSKDGITDKKLKERAGYALSIHLSKEWKKNQPHPTLWSITRQGMQREIGDANKKQKQI